MPSALFRVAWLHSNFGWLWLVVVCWFCAGSFGWGQLVDVLGSVWLDRLVFCVHLAGFGFGDSGRCRRVFKIPNE